MKEHTKAVVWPRKPAADADGRPVYRYAVVGMIVTDTPVPEFEGRNEVLLDGESLHVLLHLRAVASRPPSTVVGDASAVLVSLDEL